MNEKLQETVEGMRAQLVEALLIALKEKQAEYIEEEEDEDERYFCAERDTKFELGRLIEQVTTLDAPQLVVLTAIANVSSTDHGRRRRQSTWIEGRRCFDRGPRAAAADRQNAPRMNHARNPLTRAAARK
jgi:hypothetical protein